MSLVNIDSVQRQVLQLLKKVEAPGGIELSSYKRNRSISIAVISPDQVVVKENGYEVQELTVHKNNLSKLLKTMIKREFPRSRKVRIHKFADPSELNRLRKTL